MRPRLSVISLYTGVGGLDFGLEAAGFKTAVALEMDKTCCETLRVNRRWPVLEGDIHVFASRDILATAKLKRGEAALLAGGPPCQPFSKSSYWVSGDARRLKDPRSSTLGAYLRVLEDTLPRVFLLENVHGLAFDGKDEGLRFLLNGIKAINDRQGTNYSVEWKVLNTAEYGIPQIRERVFMIGDRLGRKFHFPIPTHSETGGGDLFSRQEPYRTAWDALGDLPEDPDEPSLEVGGAWGALLPSIPEGKNYLWHTNRGGGLPLFGWRTRYWSFLLKLSKALPSWTVQAQPGTAIGPFHWASRRLSKAELCRIQTFPDGLRFNCGRTEVQRMLGNAVPSLMAEILGRHIRAQLLDSPPRGPLKLLPPVRTPRPAEEPIVTAPDQYRSLVGVHADHPGTGLGRRAAAKQVASA